VYRGCSYYCVLMQIPRYYAVAQTVAMCKLAVIPLLAASVEVCASLTDIGIVGAPKPMLLLLLARLSPQKAFVGIRISMLLPHS
jgi:hypothetical protein